jgi:hypothetical protein
LKHPALSPEHAQKFAEQNDHRCQDAAGEETVP